jgi:hypothetical protein
VNHDHDIGGVFQRYPVARFLIRTVTVITRMRMHDNLVQHSRAGNRRIAARVVDDDDQVDNFLRDDLTPRLLDRPLCVVCGLTTTPFS